MMKNNNITDTLKEKGLKVTPQRIRVMEAIIELDGKHPMADQIIHIIRRNDPNISVGTIYNVLDTFVKHNLIKKLKTEKGIMRYDGNTKNHHHIYSHSDDEIADFTNEDLDDMLNAFFAKHRIKDFSIESINLNINGNFNNNHKK
jgi:Fur family peroxide stress response transcriptional regulator